MIFALLFGAELYGILGALVALPIGGRRARDRRVPAPRTSSSSRGGPPARWRCRGSRGCRRRAAAHARSAARSRAATTPSAGGAAPSSTRPTRPAERTGGERRRGGGVAGHRGRGDLEALRTARRAAGRLLRGARRASSWRSSVPTARARPRCCRSSPGSSRRRRRRVSRAAARGRLGARSSPRSTRSSRWRENLRAVRAPREASPTPSAAVARHARADRPRRPRGRRARAAVGRQPPAREHRDRACSPTRRCCCSTSRRRRWTRASASGCGSSSTAWPRAGTTVVFSTHDVGEAERYADRVLVLADGELLFTGTPAALEGVGRRRPSRLRGRLRALPARARPLRPTRSLMRWLLLKDLQILRRSPLLVALLIAYPVIDQRADRPRAVARPGEAEGRVRQRGPGVGAHVPGRRRAHRRVASTPTGCSRRSTRSRVDSREEAIAKVRDGDVLGALIIPADVDATPAGRVDLTGSSSRRRSRSSTTARTRSRRSSSSRRSRRSWPTPTRRCRDADHDARPPTTSTSSLTAATSRSSARHFDVLGLERSRALLAQAIAPLPPGSTRRDELRPRQRLRAARDRQPGPVAPTVLASVGEPIAVKRTVLDGPRTPLDAFAVAVSRDDLAHVRRRPARRGHARARARGARVRAGSSAGWCRALGLLAEKVGARRAVARSWSRW